MVGIQKNILLKNHSTFKIGGPARYFTTVRKTPQLVEFLRWAEDRNLPVFVLGNGSNILFPDEIIEGLVIKIQISDIKQEGEMITCGAGAPLGKILEVSAKNSLSGLEWSAGIPGTIGGAIFGNAGSLGKETKDVVESVKAIRLKDFKTENFSKNACSFSYRSSVFREKGGFIILEARLKLQKSDKKFVEERIKNNLSLRAKKQPLDYPSIGSIFKNVKITDKKNPEFKKFLKAGKIPAAYLVASCGLKGKIIGDAKVSEKHSNFIINLGKASSRDVLNLIVLIKEKVKDKFGIELEEEIILANF